MVKLSSKNDDSLLYKKIDKLSNLVISSDNDYNSKTDEFGDVNYLIVINVNLGAQRAPLADICQPRSASKHSALVHMYINIIEF